MARSSRTRRPAAGPISRVIAVTSALELFCFAVIALAALKEGLPTRSRIIIAACAGVVLAASLLIARVYRKKLEQAYQANFKRMSEAQKNAKIAAARYQKYLDLGVDSPQFKRLAKQNRMPPSELKKSYQEKLAQANRILEGR